MKFIAHRGNINGPNIKMENKPSYIIDALNLNYNVEIDVWFVDKMWWLGHDKPQYKMNSTFLFNHMCWKHIKNWEALEKIDRMEKTPYFWHQDDDYTLTSNGYVWVYPTKELINKSICVLPEKGYSGNISKCYGICSDYISQYKENYL